MSVGGDWSEGGGGWRRGGPLGDRPPNNQAQPETVSGCKQSQGIPQLDHSYMQSPPETLCELQLPHISVALWGEVPV